MLAVSNAQWATWTTLTSPTKGPIWPLLGGTASLYLTRQTPSLLAASAVVPYLVTSVVNCTLSEKSLKGVEFVDMAKDTLGGIWTLGLLSVVFDMISNKLIPTWVAFHTILRDKKYLKGRRLMNRE